MVQNLMPLKRPNVNQMDGLEVLVAPLWELIALNHRWEV
jgi:hypothetical protein